ncbi:hypothetical protein LWM68_06430 [Niabella sp. W65]|nr:hypothetical protein [Niabella sp. W65]MCH7362432.1 hypothetical protein [Niabella sp. W65]
MTNVNNMASTTFQMMACLTYDFQFSTVKAKFSSLVIPSEADPGSARISL